MRSANFTLAHWLAIYYIYLTGEQDFLYPV